VRAIGNAFYAGRARCGMGGSANSGQQAGRENFRENKFFVRLKVLKVWTKGASCPLQNDGAPITRATNQMLSSATTSKFPLRDKVWEQLTKEQRERLVEKLEQREAAFSSSGREAVPRYRAQATHRRAVPLYNAESVRNSQDFPKPSAPSFATILEHLKLRSLPPSTRPNVSPAGADWKSFGWIQSHFANLHMEKQDKTPAKYLAEQFEIPWARELLRQVCELAKREAERAGGHKVYFTALGVGKNNVTSWHKDAGNRTNSTNFQFAVGNFGDEMGYVGADVNAGRVVLLGPQEEKPGDAKRGLRGPDGKNETCLLRDCRSKWIAFDPFRTHRTETHGGDRWVVTCYTHDPPPDAKEKAELVAAMKQLRFPLPPDWK